MKKMRKKIKQAAIKGLDIPEDVILNLPKITVVGFSQLYIENYRELVKFTDEYIVLKLKEQSIKITGKSLIIRKIAKEEIFIEGNIKEFHCIKGGDRGEI